MDDYHAELVKRLDALVIIDEMRSDNQLGKDAARAIEALVRERRNNLSELDRMKSIIKDAAREGDIAYLRGREAGIREAAHWVRANLCDDSTVDDAILFLIDKPSE